MNSDTLITEIFGKENNKSKLTNMELKKDWNDADFAESKKAIRRFLKSRKFETNEENDAFRFINTFKQIDKIVGLAYTSSSAITAMYVCSLSLFFDAERKYQIKGFALGVNGYFYALCENYKDEDFLYVMI